MNSRDCLRREKERGQTIVLVAFCLMAIIAFAALAIDVSTLYVARNQAQEAADAAALAGAQAFVRSGYTSGFISQAVAQSDASQQATIAGQQVSVGGRNLQASEISVSFPTSTQNNPVISVTVARTGLPTFFARIWGTTSTVVGATAKAEAYNPSGLGSSSPNIAVINPKPFAVPNCNPTPGAPPGLGSNCGASEPPFFDSTNNYAIVAPSYVVGQSFLMHQLDTSSGPPAGPIMKYYAIDLPVSAASVSCPAPTQISCGSVDPTTPSYFETVACTNSIQLTCGQTFTVDPASGGALTGTTRNAGMCLIHAKNPGLGNGQDLFCNNSFPCSFPIEIDGGGSNPDPSLNGKNFISRSDSVITVPVWDGTQLCTGGACNTGTVIGFLQLGIDRMRAAVTGGVAAVILNAVGCGSAPANNVATASTSSPVLVRLIN